jgi:hypothetical protein
MKYLKRGLMICIVLSILVPIVLAGNGCCALTYNDDTCVYTSEDNCASTSEGYFSLDQTCTDAAFCGTGCCIKPDGLCGDGAGDYACNSIEGAEYYSGKTCGSFSECENVCCQYGTEFTYMTEAACYAEYVEYGGGAEIHQVSTTNGEQECQDLSRAEDTGCCVTEDSCITMTFEECLVDFDDQTGYGFYNNQLCSDVSDNLEDQGVDAAESCSCESKAYALCENRDIRWYDGCNNPQEIDECQIGTVCSIADNGNPSCISTDCSSTFKFTTEPFTDFNEYKVYNFDATKDDDYTTLKLGDSRKNSESWCIYESPVGGFQDRVGSQHYVSSCVDGEEQITSCGEAREEVCVVEYDTENNRYTAGCQYNNHLDYYGEGGSDLYSSSNFRNVRSSDDPVKSADKSTTNEDYIYGVSTVPVANRYWLDNEQCGRATFTCDVWYGDYSGGENTAGWESYVNTFCLRPEFVTTSIDYCGSRGDCGIKENVIGDRGSGSGFDVVATPDTVGLTYRAAEGSGDWDHPLPVGVSGPDKHMWYGGCFNPQNEDSGGTFGELLTYTLQGQDYIGDYVVDQTIDVWECMFWGEADVREDYFSRVAEYSKPVVNTMYGRKYLNSPWLDLYTLIRRSGAFVPSEDEIAESQETFVIEIDAIGSKECTDSSKSFVYPSQGLGFNIPQSKGDFLQSDAASWWTKEFQKNSGLTNDLEDNWEATDKKLKEFVKGTSSSRMEELYGPMVKNPDGKILANNLVSIKPWYFSSTALSQDLYSGEVQPSNYLSYYAGDSNCKGSNEWTNTEGNRKKSSVKFDCNGWNKKSDEENKCQLCDKVMSEGGLVYDKDGKIFTATVCNEFRCRSLGDCAWLGPTIEDPEYGNNPIESVYNLEKPSCVEAYNCGLGGPVLNSYFGSLSVEGAIITEYGTAGYEVSNIPVKKTFEIGVETDQYTECKFLDLDTIEGEFSDYLAQKVGETDLTKAYDLIGPGAPVFRNDTGEFYDNGLSYIHTVTTHIDESEGTKEFYVYCQNKCDDMNTAVFDIKLSAKEGPDEDIPEFKTTVPLSEKMVPAVTEEITLEVMLDEPSTCRWSESEIDDYFSMENDFGLCDKTASAYAFYSCYDEIDLTDYSTRTLYFLCKDESENVWTQAQKWTVTKSSELLISQTSPSGDIFDSSVTLQVQTTGGVDNGNSICSYQLDGQDYAVNMDLDPASYHESILSPSEGDYSYAIYCEDEIGNTAESAISFSMAVDREAASVEAIYYLSGTLYVITDEPSICQIGTESIVYGQGTEMAGSGTPDHSYPVENSKGTYYVTCIDAFANEMGGLKIDLRYYSN